MPHLVPAIRDGQSHAQKAHKLDFDTMTAPSGEVQKPGFCKQQHIEHRLFTRKPQAAYAQWKRAQRILASEGWYPVPVLLRFGAGGAEIELVSNWLEEFVGPFDGGPWVQSVFRTKQTVAVPRVGFPGSSMMIFGFGFEQESAAMVFRLQWSEFVIASDRLRDV